MSARKAKRARSSGGNRSPKRAHKTKFRTVQSIHRTSTRVNVTPRLADLTPRSLAARARALHALADLRRDPAKILSQAARDRKVSLRTIRRYIGSQLRQERPGGRIAVTKSDRLSAVLYIPTTKPDVFQEIHARGSKERYLVGEWMAAINEAESGKFTRLDKFPRGQFVDGVRLPTGSYEVRRILETLAASEKPFEDLYALTGSA